MRVPLALLTLVPLLAGGALAAPKEDPAAVLRGAAAPAWSLRATDDQLIVQISPVRQTLQIAGSYGLVLGSVISATQDEKYSKAIMAVLEDFDAGKEFEARLTERIREVVGERLKKTAPLGSTAGYNSLRDAQDARYESLGKQGVDALLDLKMTYGLFGYEGTLIAKLEGDLLKTPKGSAVWRRTVVASSAPCLASDRLTDPTKNTMPAFASPRLSVGENAIDQWTADGGEIFRKRFAATVDGVISAVFTDLGLVDEPLGAYYLGKQAMNQKRFKDADALLRRAIAGEADNLDYKNALSVNTAHQKKVTEAIALAKEIAASAPDYGPAQHNLAWWYAVELGDAASAKPYYDRSLALGMPAEKKIEKKLGK